MMNQSIARRTGFLLLFYNLCYSIPSLDNFCPTHNTTITSSDFFLTPMDKKDTIKAREHALHFYADELLKAGQCQNQEEALAAAHSEFNQEETSPQNYFFHINSSPYQTPLGYLWYSLKNQDAYIEFIFLEKEYRDRGIGEQVLRNVETKLRDKRLNSIVLYVFAHNKTAYKLYNKLGYETTNSYTNDAGIVGFHMKKKL
jgi:ribosomal protein S18 acetylase RimI-like enzyme